MTPEELQLDPKFFLANQPFLLYRLARARYANLSGIGAASAPGRWNRSGEEAIYTSTEMGVPVLERLVHTPKDVIPSNLALMKIRVNGNWEIQKMRSSTPERMAAFGSIEASPMQGEVSKTARTCLQLGSIHSQSLFLL